MRERITKLLELWFLQEEALFKVFCSHDLVENNLMKCPIRTGKGRIEYSSELIREMSDGALEEAMRTEAVRILLKHPYERRPDLCSQQAITVGSNITIGDNYKYSSFRIPVPKDLDLKEGMPYEWYAMHVQSLLNKSQGGDEEDEGQSGRNGETSSSSNDNGRQEISPSSPAAGSDKMEQIAGQLADSKSRDQDLSELWEEDELQIAKINGIIDSVKKWGSLGGQFAEKLQASTKAKINWRNVLAGFRASILSSKRKLTRMKPNRRSGFEQMGSRKDFTTKLLVAVDVSGSISSESLSYFYGVINSAFKYGFESVDVIEFDAGITKIESLKKKMKEVCVLGRGGTSFQEPVDYAHQNRYDGLLILTDGYAPAPTIPAGMRTKLFWVCENKEAYKAHHEWMEKLGRVCVVELS